MAWLCQTKRVLAMETEILKRAWAYFARDNNHLGCRLVLLTSRRRRRLSFGCVL
jgi:hypothetical protein